MSGFEILGAAATICQFIEYSIHFSNKFVAAYRSEHDLDGLRSTTAEFQKENELFLRKLESRSPGPDLAQMELMKTARECQQAATHLVDEINSIAPQDDKRSPWKAFKATSKSELRKGAILSRQSELTRLRRKLHNQLKMIMSDEQYALAESLKRLEQNQMDLNSKVARQLIEFKKELIKAAKDPMSLDYTALPDKLLDAQSLGLQRLPGEIILSSLIYSDISSRRDRIQSPSHSTYNWMFEPGTLYSSFMQPQKTDFITWLEKRDGIYWVTGKAGSGKSTLMKHICEHARTARALERWAKDRKLLVASHYSVLYSCPDIIEKVCTDRWTDEVSGRDTRYKLWEESELVQCLDRLVDSKLTQKGQDLCFCFFVDGLDEYDGGYEVVDGLVRLATSGHVKICASSRPWNKFEHAFKPSQESGSYLRLHEHTKDDIRMVVNAELKGARNASWRADNDFKSLINEVVDRSEGVFLWVMLVVKKELRPMLDSRESIQSLRERLSMIPTDLADYFGRIWMRIWADTKYRRDTARIFQSCIAADEPLPIAAIRLLLATSPQDEAIFTHIDFKYAWDDELEVDNMRAQVNGRCQDLLEVETPSAWGASASIGQRKPEELCRIRFLHRSVRDFLHESEAVTRDLQTHAGKDFDVQSALVACYVFLIKKTPSLGNSRSLLSGGIVANWCIEALVHLHDAQPDAATTRLLRELDRTMQLTYAIDSRQHWSNLFADNPGSSNTPGKTHPPVQTNTSGGHTVDLRKRTEASLHMYSERGNRDLLGQLIEFGITSQVDAMTKTKPSVLRAKGGRPYLDYALRFEAGVPYRAGSRKQVLEQFSGDHAMVQLLLDRGCDPNQVVYIYEDRTVWDLYLSFLLDNKVEGGRYERITWLLIRGGARAIDSHALRSNVSLEHGPGTFQWMQEVLEQSFGGDQANAMCERIVENNKPQGWWFW